ncbi:MULTISPECIES: thiamine pyrophosphate-dependent enzyme [Glutamicibacter]|uniref:Acetolactate synthase isozyme 2 large subunit n=1 Tax=Glutamicibacter creatinolyticus TaxID=162496 RepID=A0A5B7WWU0_9MICC|nr:MULTISPECIES: thiamine pyrophosphate-dependent enzyme [Glutamicibacter]QCY48362.1 Acetolactate synthase isozyme 2 large subunit [Glutamicibacter creatinolyticus]TLK48378.1 acetolactate synthase [Glutamicibacter sp. V16R2B1]
METSSIIPTQLASSADTSRRSSHVVRPTHAGAAIVESLARHGVKRVFTVPGESYLAVLDGLHDANIDNIVVRHEGGAAYMAEAHGKFTGQPGVAMVTRGPGAANAYVAVHSAWQDGTPMVLFVGLIPVADRMRESFQEFDPYAWFGSQAKRVFVIDEAERASEIVAEAFFAAASGRPGPVIVGLPEDVVAHEFAGELHQPLTVAEGAVSTGELKELASALSNAQKPLLFVGGQRWSAKAAAGVTAFAEANNIPVVHDWHAADRVPFNSPVNMGELGYGRTDKAAQMFEEADVLVAIGAVPSDVPTDGFTLRQNRRAVNYLVNIDTSLRGRSGAITRHILATPGVFAEALEELRLERETQWEPWRAAGREAREAYTKLPQREELSPTREGTAHMSAVIAELVQRLPEDVVTTMGAGNHCAWPMRYVPTNIFPSQLGTRNGSMGYSIPAAVAASLEAPERLVLAICGDGEFLMNGQELASATQHGAALLTVVMDNGQFGTIRAHQEGHFPGRVSGTQLQNPDFAALARAYGGHGETVTSDAQAAEAVQRALDVVLKEHRPALLHVIVDQGILFP